MRRPLRGARSSLSRSTADFEILRPRDSASMSATKGSGSRTVRVFMPSVYYIRQLCKTRRRTSVTADNRHPPALTCILNSSILKSLIPMALSQRCLVCILNL